MKFIMRALLLLLIFSLAACASKPHRKPSDSPTNASSANHTANGADQASKQADQIDPCAPIYEHDEKLYTAGGLYAPKLSDSAPASAIDISKLVEPTPTAEALARYGNKTPYKVLGKTYRVLDRSEPYDERGIASWYGQKFNGRKTSSGEIYSICEFSAAHKTLPLPSYVRVTNTTNGLSVIVRVNDRGPFHEGRIIDLSYVAAIRIGLDKNGTAPVRIELIDIGNHSSSSSVSIGRPENKGAAADEVVSLQFGSFSDKDNAKRLRDRLDGADIDDVELEKAEIAGDTVWRVLLHDVKNEQLPDIFEKIRYLGMPKPKVVSQKP